ncbi:MAG: hypothetical protein AAF708_20020 [Deinococcota bacterium]
MSCDTTLTFSLKLPGRTVYILFTLFILMLPTKVLIVPLFDLISQQPPKSLVVFWQWFSNSRQALLGPGQFGFG